VAGPGYFGIESHLYDAFSVAEVNEDKTAVVTASIHPSGQRYCLAKVLFIQLTTTVTFKQCQPSEPLLSG
jgi:hypothetical protein